MTPASSKGVSHASTSCATVQLSRLVSDPEQLIELRRKGVLASPKAAPVRAMAPAK